MEEKINLKNLVVVEEEKLKNINNSFIQFENENSENNHTNNQYKKNNDRKQNNAFIFWPKFEEDKFDSTRCDTHILLKKEIKKGDKYIGKMYPYESIDNKENINLNYNLNLKFLFNEKTSGRNQEGEKKNYENKIINSYHDKFNIFNKFEKIRNNNFLYKDIHSYLSKETNNNNQLKEKNEIKKENKIYKNNYNYSYIINSINHKEKLKIEIENEPQKEKLTILEYLKRIKKIKKPKNYKEENKSFENSIKQKEKTPKSEANNQKVSFSKTENKNNKVIIDYKNKIKNNKKNLNLKNENYKNEKDINLSNFYFDLKKYLEKKKDIININKNNISYSNKKYFGNNKYINTYCKEEDKNNKIEEFNNININELSSVEPEFAFETDIFSNNKQKKIKRNKYVESRIVSDKNLNIFNELNEKNNFNNSFQNIFFFEKNTDTKKKIRKRNNYLNEKNKTINFKYSLNDICESSLDKRKKYSQTVKSRVKNREKNKDKNKSILMAKDKSNTTMENKKCINSLININFKLINSKNNKSKNLDSNESFGVRNELFTTSKKNHKNKFINTYNNYKNNCNDISNDMSLLTKIDKIKNIRRNNNSYKKSYEKESDYSKKRKIIGKNNLKLKIKNKNFNNKNLTYKFKKGKTNILCNFTDNSKINIKNNEILKINNIKSIDNYQYKNRKKISKNNIINTNSFSNKLITNYCFSNTKKSIKLNIKRGRNIKNNEFNLNNNNTLIKSYEGNNYNKLNNSYYNTNNINSSIYSIKNSFLNKSKKKK